MPSERYPQNAGAGSLQQARQLIEAMRQRVAAVDEIVQRTLTAEETEILAAIETFKNWMLSSAIVRVVGAGRTRLALAIPANRLAHGGAQVSVLDGMIPMPNTNRGGAILAASASGANSAILHVLHDAKRKEPTLKLAG